MEILGIDIGGTSCRVAKAGTDATGALGYTLAEIREFPSGGVDQTLERIYAAIDELSNEVAPCVGISCGGPLDTQRGLICSPPNLPEWDEIPIVERIERRFGGRAFLMNDANAGALAEWRFGAGRGLKHLAFLTFGTGLGAGLILNGALYEGATGNAGEVGHLRLTSEGPLGHGKQGSVEGWCSGGGIARLLESYRTKGETGIPWCDARALSEAASSGNLRALEIYKLVGSRLGWTIAILADLLDLEAVILGSLYFRCRPWLEASMYESLSAEALPANIAALRILPAELGERLGPMQALAVALYNLENI